LEVSKPLRVLIVEDSEDDAELIVNQLERSGYEPSYERVDNLDAMTTALEKEQWDVVLADYSLPRFSATAALSLLQSKQLDLPFIIISGSIADGIAVAAMKAGAHDYLMKGNLARLVPVIEREVHEAANRRDRQQMQSALRASEDRWQLALQGNNDGIWDWNIQSNTVFFSARWKEMLGYTEDEITNHFAEWSKRVHPEDLNWVTEALQDHLAGKTQFYGTEHRIRCKEGKYKWILARGQALWDEAGKPIRMVGSHTDITPAKQMEEALRQQAESLAEANRLKDEFLAIVSHELRTPLNAILGWSQMLRYRKFDEAKVAQALETIERNAKLQKQLIEDLLDVSCTIQGKLNLTVAPTNLVPLIEAAIETLQTAADAKAIQVKFLVDDSVALVSGDANRLQQVVWNLLSNAIKFTPQGGRVEIRLSKGERRDSSSSPVAYIQVSDSGIGIKAEFLPYVFDRFRQENSSITRCYGGLGLGLAIVRDLVELHGGTVQADSPGEGQGTTFTVRLPLIKGERQEAGGERSDSSLLTLTPSASLLTGLQILVVDDDTDTREFLVTALTEYGANVTAAASANEALKALERLKPDVLVSDIGMPAEDGYVLIRRVRNLESKQPRDIPAVALTAYARESDLAKAVDAGFQMHLSKPIEPNELVAVVAQLARRTTPV